VGLRDTEHGVKVGKLYYPRMNTILLDWSQIANNPRNCRDASSAYTVFSSIF
jgi:hypothetical protein